jgi:hypothetical protein
MLPEGQVYRRWKVISFEGTWHIGKTSSGYNNQHPLALEYSLSLMIITCEEKKYILSDYFGVFADRLPASKNTFPNNPLAIIDCYTCHANPLANGCQSHSHQASDLYQAASQTDPQPARNRWESVN